MVELCILVWIFKWRGGWTRLEDTWSEGESLDIRLDTGLFDRTWSFILGDFLLNRSTTFADAMTSFRQM